MSLVPFDDRDGWIWFDGRFVPWRDAKIHVLTHALHYGSAVFEGERMYDGQIFELQAHTNRLFRSAELLDFTIPYTQSQVNRACEDACARNGLTDCYVRPIAWRGAEQLGVSALQTTIHMAIAVWAWPKYFDEAKRAQGIRLCWAKYRRPPASAAPTADDSAASSPRFLAFRERGVWRGCRMVVGPRQRGHRSQADSRRCRRRVRKTPRRAVGFRDHRRFDRRPLMARFQGTWERPDRAQVKQANSVLQERIT